LSFIAAIVGLLHELLSFFWLVLVEPRVNSVDRDQPVPPRPPVAAESPRVSARADSSVSREFLWGARVEAPPPVADTPNGNGKGKAEVYMSDSFLAQLEQRTEQVKITLANLEAEKVRIEAQIAQLQPVVPHYDALLVAERALQEANVTIEASHPAPQPAPGWNNEPQQPANSW
jgi:hypothetical protein